MVSPRFLTSNGNAFVDYGDGLTRVPIADNDPLRSSFGIYIPGYVPPANPTDILQIQGSATKNVRVRSIVITGTATTAWNVNVQVFRRSTAGTGGTSALQTMVNRDIQDDAPTASVRLFSANQSALGTLVGLIDGGRLNIAPAANGGIDHLALQYGWLNDKTPVLRGVNDFLCIGFGGAAWPSGGALDINIVLTED